MSTDDKSNSPDEKQCFYETLHNSVSTQTCVNDYESESIENDSHNSDVNVFLYSTPFLETSSENLNYCNTLESSKIIKTI